MPLAFHHHRFPNGLDLIAEPNPDAHSIAMGFFVKTGSRDETDPENGVSHFLEHMMFKGSEKCTWEDVNRIFDEIGARYNAYTSQENTVYYANVLPEFTDRALEHLSWLLRPSLRQADFDTEKNVILEEIAMYLDDPGQRLYEIAMAQYFGAHPLSKSVLGTVQSVKDLAREQMLDYYSRRYSAGNIILSVTGNLDFADLVQRVDHYCGQWKPADSSRTYPTPVNAEQHKHVPDPKLNRAYAMGFMPGPSAQDTRRFAARVLADVIGDSEGSRFYWALVDNAIAEDADFGFYPHDRCGSFYLTLVTDPARMEKAIDIARKELAKVAKDITVDEIERAKNKIASGIVLQGEIPLGRMRAIGGQWMYNGNYRSLEDDMKTLLSINRDLLVDLMTQYPFGPLSLVTLAPK